MRLNLSNQQWEGKKFCVLLDLFHIANTTEMQGEFTQSPQVWLCDLFSFLLKKVKRVYKNKDYDFLFGLACNLYELKCEKNISV